MGLWVRWGTRVGLVARVANRPDVGRWRLVAVIEGPVVYQAQLEYDQGDAGEEHPEVNNEVCGDHVADAVEHGNHVAEACLVPVFAVVLVTLVVQGMTLRPLLVWLDVRDDGTVEREVQVARVETLRAALEAVRTCGGGESAELLRRRYELRLRRAEQDAPDRESDSEDAEIIRAAMAAERQRLIELRDNGTIGDAAFQQVEQELDLSEVAQA